MKKLLTALQTKIRLFWFTLRKENIIQLFFIVFGIIFSTAVIIYILERAHSKDIRSFADALWWSIVTATTVGYGDKIPHTGGGRIIAGMLMVSGIITLALVSGTVASILTEKKLKEGRGLEVVKNRGHLVMCGWNSNAEKILQAVKMNEKNIDLVLINELDEERMNEVIFKFPDLKIRWVRGNFTHESVLRRANVQEAKSVILLADTTAEGGTEKSDERTIIAAHTIRFLSSDVRITAELIDSQNEQHLRRTDVDDIIIGSEYGGFLLAKATLSPGIPQVFKDLLHFERENELMRTKIPDTYVGKTFKELQEYFRKQHSILIGILSEEKGIRLEDILTDDTSSIDLFIKKKFQEAKMTSFASPTGKFQVNINPEDDYKICEDDEAIIIGRKK